MSFAALIPLAVRVSSVAFAARERTPSLLGAARSGLRRTRCQRRASDLAFDLSSARRSMVVRAEEPGKNAPKDGLEEIPPWVRREMEREAASYLSMHIYRIKLFITIIFETSICVIFVTQDLLIKINAVTLPVLFYPIFFCYF